VPQPVEWITSENGNQALCYYSLGNYVSTQKQALCMLEEMAWVTFRVTESGVEISDKNTGVIPMVCHYKSGPVRLKQVYLLEDYTEEMALSHGIWNYAGVPLHLNDLESKAEEIFGDFILKKSDVIQFNQDNIDFNELNR
jgi:poly-gamma-glutamate synthesis protein (capsule biosynthesis protein)